MYNKSLVDDRQQLIFSTVAHLNQTESDTQEDSDCRENDEDDENSAFEFTDEDINQVLNDEDVEDDGNITPVNTSNDYGNVCEGDYMPMTPRKTDNNKLTPVFQFQRTSSITAADLEKLEKELELLHEPPSPEEENDYVEMTQGTSLRSVFASSDYSNDSVSNYEPISINSQTKIDDEPVYMELSTIHEHSNSNTLTNKSKTKDRLKNKKKNQTENLPDILKTQLHSYDSSDGENDEDLNELKKVKLRSRNRLSLSDTFRPASYYLGASTPMNPCHDSSDSEIVSPPPIPTSPPPLDELSLSETTSQGNGYGTINDSFKQLRTPNKAHSSNPVLSMNKNIDKCSSMLSLPDKLQKNRVGNRSSFDSFQFNLENKILSESNYSFNTDDGSNTSSDYDFYNKLKLESPSFSDCNPGGGCSNNIYENCQSRTASNTNSENEFSDAVNDSDYIEKLNKRKPVSVDSFIDLEAVDEPNQYLNNLQINDLYLYGNNHGGGGVDDPMTKISEIHYIKPPKVFCNDNETDTNYFSNQLQAKYSDKNNSMLQLSDVASNFDGSISNINSSLNDFQTETQSEHNSSLTIASLREQNLAYLDDTASIKSDLLIRSSSPRSRSTSFDMSRPLPAVHQHFHSRTNSNISDSSSAPYYYSDLVVSTSSIDVSKHEPDLMQMMQLNNQRDVGNKRMSGISHIHNPINTKNDNVCDERDKNVNNSMSCEGGGKEKNLINYYTNTKDSNEKINKNLNTKHLNTIAIQSTSSRIVNNAIDNAIYSSNLFYQRQSGGGGGGTMGRQPKPKERDISAGDHVWEEDMLWRENLRRVSHRHAQSLDDLDKISSPKFIPPSSKTQKKITRNSTYVNDNYENCIVSRGKPFTLPASTVTTAKLDDIQRVDNENDVYVQLSVDASESSELYEVLRDESVRVVAGGRTVTESQRLLGQMYEKGTPGTFGSTVGNKVGRTITTTTTNSHSAKSK